MKVNEVIFIAKKGKWSDKKNWNTGRKPTKHDSVIIPSGAYCLYDQPYSIHVTRITIEKNAKLELKNKQGRRAAILHDPKPKRLWYANGTLTLGNGFKICYWNRKDGK